MEFLIIIGTFEAVFLAILLLFKKNKIFSDYILFSYFIFFGIHLILFYGEYYNYAHDYPYPALIMTRVPFALLYGPFLWLYVFSFVKGKTQLKLYHLCHLIPFIALTVYLTNEFYILEISEKINSVKEEAFMSDIFYAIFMIMIILSGPLYIIWCLNMLKKYKSDILNRFSYTEKIDMAWLRYLFIGLGTWWGIVFIIGGIFLIFNNIDLFTFSIIIFAGAAIFVLFIGFFGIKQGTVFINQKNSGLYNESRSQENISKKGISLDVGPDETFLELLLNLMQTRKPYSDNNLNIDQLAEMLRTQPVYLSKIINKKLNKNFYDFINEYRVKEFKSRIVLPENKQFTIISIAYDCGFNSKASFYRIFKNFTGLTPTEFKSKITHK